MQICQIETSISARWFIRLHSRLHYYFSVLSLPRIYHIPMGQKMKNVRNSSKQISISHYFHSKMIQKKKKISSHNYIVIFSWQRQYIDSCSAKNISAPLSNQRQSPLLEYLEFVKSKYIPRIRAPFGGCWGCWPILPSLVK